MRILFVCTGNIFRSPMAQGFLVGLAERRGVDLNVTSAATLSGERHISPIVLEMMGEDGQRMTGHRSRELAAEELRAVDLVVGMAREHVREAILIEPTAWWKTFTLKELVRRGETVGPRPPSQELHRWLELVAQGRSRSDLLGASDQDDVADPHNAEPRVGQATALEIRSLVGRLLDLLEPNFQSEVTI